MQGIVVESRLGCSTSNATRTEMERDSDERAAVLNFRRKELGIF